MRTLVRMTGITAIAIALAACSSAKVPERKAADEYQSGDGFSIRQLVGVSKSPPDEFAVIASKPLQMPSDFASLPPPDPGARSALVADPVAEARAALLGEVAPTPASTRLSTSEGALLAATGTADPTIRATIEAEQEELNSTERRYLLQEVFPSMRGESADSLKPAEERERLSALSGGSRAFDPAPTVATIPTTPTVSRTPVQTPVQAPALPPETRPLVETVTSGARPAVDPVMGGELIFIPE